MESLFKPKRLVINTIQRGAPVTAKSKTTGETVTRPGNIIINGMWFSSVEWRNNLLGAELPIELPVAAFKGVTISYDELEITQELLDKNGGVWKEIIRGREVSFTKPGINRNNLVIDFGTLQVTDNTVNLMKVKQLFPSLRADQRRPAPSRPAAPATNEEIIDETIDETTQPHENGNGQPAATPATQGEHVDLNVE